MHEKITSSVDALQKDHVLGDSFSKKILETVGEKDKELQKKIDALITLSELYKGDLDLIQEALAKEIDTQGLLTRQHETHDQFIETLSEVRDRARIYGHKELSDIPDTISRPYSAKVALFIANEYKDHEKNNQ